MVTTVADRAWSDEELDELTARMEREYAQAAREMTEKLNEQMKSYEEGRAEWLERLDESPELQSEYESWLRSQAARQEYLQDMTTSLAKDATEARRKANDAINNTLPRVYAEGANHAAFEIDSALHMRTAFSLVDEDTVRVLMTSQVSVPKEMRWNRQHFTSALTQGILQGESVPNVAKRMRNVLGMGYRSSVRAARTALTGAENAGRVESYNRAKEMGIELEQEWLAALDSRTRHSHRLLDGERVEVGKKFSNGCRFPGDPEGLPEEVYNCRCTLVAALDDEEDDGLEGRWSKLPDGTTYDEWRGKHTTKDYGFADTNNRLYQRAYTHPDAYELFEGEYDTDDVTEVINLWKDGEAYDIRWAQQMGYANKNGEYIEELISNCSVPYGLEDGSRLWRGICVDDDTYNSFLALRESESAQKIDMLGTSSWTSDEKVSQEFARNAAGIGDLDLEGASRPVVFELTELDSDLHWGMDIEGVGNSLNQSEVLLSKNAEFYVTDMNEVDGVLHVEVVAAG